MKKKFGPRGGSPDRDERPRSRFGDKPQSRFGDKSPSRFGDSGRDRPSRGNREDRPFGDKPRGERSFGDRAPRGNRPFGDSGRDRPFRDRDEQSRDRPRDRSFGDRPRRDNRPFGDSGRDRPFGDRPPRGDRPFKPKREERGPSRDATGRPGQFERDTRGMYKKERTEESETGPRPSSRTMSGIPHLGKDEFRFYGKNACLAIWKNRPKDIVRIYVEREKADEYAEILTAFAKNQLQYKMVDAADLERLTDSVHHQGICVVATAKRNLQEKDLYREITGGRMLVLYLDGVGNPHNLGAILRSAAHFGIRYIALPKDSFVRLSPAANRTSEGAAEFVSLIEVENPESFFDRLQEKGFIAYSFEAKETNASIYDTRLQEKAIFVFGNEVDGVSGLVRAIVDRGVKIPGTGAVESLNVSVAAALAMAEFNRQAGAAQRSVRIVKSPG